MNALTLEERAKARGMISAFEDHVKTLPQIDVPITHHFSHGVYAREMRMNANELIVGAIHKHENLNILSSGTAQVIYVDNLGEVVKLEITAPYTLVARPGVKRVIKAVTDIVWTTIHGTHETDLEKIENEFIAKDYSQVEGISEQELKLIQEARNELGNNECGRSGGNRITFWENECGCETAPTGDAR